MARKRLCISLIGDVVHSRRRSGQARAALQKNLETNIAQLNESYRDGILARFVITTGDEFQGLLKDPQVLPQILWDLDPGINRLHVRLGLGYGTLETALKESAIGMDGPVWHRAREAIERAKRERRMGGVFSGFGEKEDPMLNGLARLLHFLRSRLSLKQTQIVRDLRKSVSQVVLARRLRITKQAVHKRARSAGWDAYKEGEDALRTLLSGFDCRAYWT